MYFNAQQKKKKSCQMAAHCKNWGFTEQAWALDVYICLIYQVCKESLNHEEETSLFIALHK